MLKMCPSKSDYSCNQQTAVAARSGTLCNYSRDKREAYGSAGPTAAAYVAVAKAGTAYIYH